VPGKKRTSGWLLREGQSLKYVNALIFMFLLAIEDCVIVFVFLFSLCLFVIHLFKKQILPKKK
jgi:hypothetical protein